MFLYTPIGHQNSKYRGFEMQAIAGFVDDMSDAQIEKKICFLLRLCWLPLLPWAQDILWAGGPQGKCPGGARLQGGFRE